jgi:hypothetical protein
MKFPGYLLKKTGRALRQWDLNSLQFRLTVGIAAVSVVGLGSVAIWKP